MSAKARYIIVIGTSAGGLEALDKLIGQLRTDLPAAIFIVQHMAPENTGGALLQRLGKYKSFNCKLAEDGETFETRSSTAALPWSFQVLRLMTEIPR
jgi:two-component system, chemotaxis family, protein-glutamate methylesterase/glutaminase